MTRATAKAQYRQRTNRVVDTIYTAIESAPYIALRGSGGLPGGWSLLPWATVDGQSGITVNGPTITVPFPGWYQVHLNLSANNTDARVVLSNNNYGYGWNWMVDDTRGGAGVARKVCASRIYQVQTTISLAVYAGGEGFSSEYEAQLALVSR